MNRLFTLIFILLFLACGGNTDKKEINKKDSVRESTSLDSSKNSNFQKSQSKSKEVKSSDNDKKLIFSNSPSRERLELHGNTVLIIKLDSAEIEQLKKIKGEESFYTGADDLMWYNSKMLQKMDSFGIPVKYTDKDTVDLYSTDYKQTIVKDSTFYFYTYFYFDGQKLKRTNALELLTNSIGSKFQKTSNSSKKSVFIGVLNDFYESEGFYVELYYSENYSNEDINKLGENHSETIYQGEEMTRTKVPLDIAQKHLDVEFIDSMYVFNEIQEIIDSISLQNIEYLDAMIESNYIATYNHSKDLTEKLVISKTNHLKNLKKSPSFQKGKKSLVEELKLNIDPLAIGEVFELNHNKDSFHIFSYTDKEYNHHIFSLKNRNITDTIEQYQINRIRPVPLASEGKIYYIVYAAVPDTDHSWTQLLGIDLKTGKFVKTRGNRLKY
ncbi:hypothetical protein [Marivirga arenosa]|uniref:Lipoprotein n=1 Tax=Marivirga arenosa TaxID=3059076 RepID=A0AA52F019_9BACT|nr:hypothetical protein [Marivirga sp. BKB1-2]WNB17933.1 hypothetical protein QYS47_28620 [Marivirga sp. BKB1-2]